MSSDPLESSAWKRSPLWTWFVGAFVLGAVLVYGITRNRSRTRGERILTNEATKANYREENRRSGGA